MGVALSTKPSLNFQDWTVCLVLCFRGNLCDTHFGADKHVQETFFQLTWINFNTDNNQCIFYCLIRHTEDPSKII